MLYCVRVADACAEGAALHQERIVAEESAKPKAAAEKTGPATGRKVVEITQQPRRGHSADGETGRGPRRGTRGGPRKKEAAPAAAPAEGAGEAPAAPTEEGGAPEAPAPTSE
jgi:hypothetical protein